MFGISGEHLLILGIILLFFGPRRLPELGNTLGKALRNFKDAVSGVEEAKFRHLENGEPQKTDPKVDQKPDQKLDQKLEKKDTIEAAADVVQEKDSGSGSG